MADAYVVLSFLVVVLAIILALTALVTAVGLLLESRDPFRRFRDITESDIYEDHVNLVLGGRRGRAGIDILDPTPQRADIYRPELDGPVDPHWVDGGEDERTP